MRLSIRNPRARALAEELTRLTGESLTDAVVHALEERLDRERNSVARGILAFAERFSAGMPKDFHSSQHEELYGYDGLPC